jgi:hypothetical protein
MKGWLTRATAAAMLLALVGCAKDPTTIVAVVEADATVPPLLILRTTVTSTADPARGSTSNRSSLEAGDASDRPGPFVFPAAVPITVDASLAGAVTVTVEGLDWDTGATLAAGSAAGNVVAQQQTTVVLTLLAVPPAADGGAD